MGVTKILRACGPQVCREDIAPSIPSPRDTLLPSLDPDVAAKMVYPPDAMPGARDFSTLRGTMRVYEWGPAAGRKVLFVHGLTTPSPVFSGLAHGLVARGCRVMLFDLWGVGYSDSPRRRRHDTALFVEQIALAMRSSTLQWDCDVSFDLIAFSLGATIGLAFAIAHRTCVKSVTLLAPGGLMPAYPEGYGALCLAHPALFPPSYVRQHVARLLGVDATRRTRPQVPPVGAEKDSQDPGPVDHTQVASEDGSAAELIHRLTQWEFDHHHGFIASFCSSVRHAPIYAQHPVWRDAAAIISGSSGPQCALSDTQLFIIFGLDDEYVDIAISKRVVGGMLGPAHVRFEHVEGDHCFPLAKAETVADIIAGQLHLNES